MESTHTTEGDPVVVAAAMEHEDFKKQVLHFTLLKGAFFTVCHTSVAKLTDFEFFPTGPAVNK